MDSLESVFNHLVLPTKLPACQDADPEAVRTAILARLRNALEALGNVAGCNFVSRALGKCQGITEEHLETKLLLEGWTDLQPDDLLIVRIAEQNAALLIRRHGEQGKDSIVLEVFETSPSAKEVLSSDNALAWEFPGRAVEIPVNKFQNASFQKNLAFCLEQASQELLPRFAAHSTKSGARVVEIRDTTDPGFVVQFFMPLLEAIGNSVNVPKVYKRVRDDVHIQKAEIPVPWRRDPAWLVLRVATQRQLCLVLGDECGRATYKFLMCALLAQLLKDCAGQLHPELTLLLRAKLCRRLAKLQRDKSRASKGASAVYKSLFASVGPQCEEIIISTTKQIETAWENFKRTITRSIPLLPHRADDESLQLSLSRSGSYLDNLLHQSPAVPTGQLSLHLPPLTNKTIEEVRRFADHCFELAKLEVNVEDDPHPGTEPKDTCRLRCIELAESICRLCSSVGNAYESKPDHMSLFILRVFELWVCLDKHAVKACPLLADYHPLFLPEALDVLQLPRLSDMKRLQDVQGHLRDRCNKCSLPCKTILSEPAEGCFASRFMALDNDGLQLRQLQRQIEDDSSLSRRNKETEWRDACREYDRLSELMAEETCVCTFNPDGSRDSHGCTKCYHKRCRKRMKISVHEDFLPTDSALKDAVVFELDIPEYLQAYRNVTWKLFREIGQPSFPARSMSVMMELQRYSQLLPYQHSGARGVSLASHTKSFLNTHFKGASVKVDRNSILLPLGLQFSYYDGASNAWIKDFKGPATFQHLCRVQIPPPLLQAGVEGPKPGSMHWDGPSSYETVASQTKCPQDMSVHEFMALQRLLAGKNRRWMTILVELGSSNVNLSAEDTMHLLSHLAVQAGPAQVNAGDVLRDVHVVFRDDLFCKRLAEQVEKRLRIIQTNWRETHCMELLVTLAHRLHSLAQGAVHRQAAERLLKLARSATLQWIRRLREEFRQTADAEAATRATRYGLGASLLCRRTFARFADGETAMGQEELCSFIEASVALQQNLTTEPKELPASLQSMLMRDMKMAYHIRTVIRGSVQAHPESLSNAIGNAWSESRNSRESIDRMFSQWKFLASPNEYWAVSVMNSSEDKWCTQQAVHLNVLEGHLFINGQPLGRLPLEIMSSTDVKELFGGQHLRTFPSHLRGMSHMLATRFHGHEIHFGQRDNNTVIRSRNRDGVFEYVPGWRFEGQTDHDLPASLIDGCAHWLNLNSGQLEMRRKPEIWKKRPGDWVLDVKTRRARRRDVFLVDPRSDLCRKINGIFRDFEAPQALTVFQPESRSGKLSVELKRLELSFFVNENRLLKCRQLNAEIDPDQDAGTLYGFESKLVLRDCRENQRRSVITGLGGLCYERRGMHVAVRVKDAETYAKFEIDTVLGRLSCLPEPRLQYSKALFHAATSFALPDPLTACTGTEEAYQILKSGYCQPWMPLSLSSEAVLMEIKNLSPARAYYPHEDSRSFLQTVKWNRHLTTAIQHDCYGRLVEEIMHKSDNLRAFDAQKQAGSADKMNRKAPSQHHLQRRAEIRRSLHERGFSDEYPQLCEHTRAYRPRDRDANSPWAVRVHETVKRLHQRPFAVHEAVDLAQILEKSPGNMIGGFSSSSEVPHCSLGTLMDGQMGERWGSLVNFCRKTNSENTYDVVFRLGLLSFSTKQNTNAIRVLCAISSLDELKKLSPPACPYFKNFKFNQHLTLAHLEELIGTLIPEKYQEVAMKSEATSLAKHLLKQWPTSAEPSREGFEFGWLERLEAKVMQRVRGEWKRLRDNLLLSNYVKQVQAVLNRHHVSSKERHEPQPWTSGSTNSGSPSRGRVIPSLPHELLLKRGPGVGEYASINDEMLLMPPVGHSASEDMGKGPPSESAENVQELESILASFAKSPRQLWRQYGNDLLHSCNALRQLDGQANSTPRLPYLGDLQQRIEKTRHAVRNHLALIGDALSAGDDLFRWLQLGSLWPRVTATTVLQQLRTNARRKFGPGMKELLISYGTLITTLQWLLRLRNETLRGNQQKLLEVWSDKGHENWRPLDFPDWLLLEIDSNFLIRREQILVANAIISPPSASNSVLQLNMGKGKTSCIVPMAVAVLADAKQLCRLIVPKALLQQTAQTLQSRIGGLVGREMRHIPFSRRSPTTLETQKLYSELHRDILERSGVILAIPEHVLSYKLSGFQRLADRKLDEAQEMINIQTWLTQNSRDVLDESDFTLAVKTQLIYPSGQLVPVDGHPDRWVTAQILLSLVQDYLPHLCRRFPRGLEVVIRTPGFPTIHILQPEIEDALQQQLVDAICDGKTPILGLPDSFPNASREEIRRLLCEESPDSEAFERVWQMFPSKPTAFKNILLVRGLLVNKILLLCLRKRWNVQYGLHPKRQPLAVPFEAKGVPSEQAEFGHPDVAILFTCLAFYYSGLTLSQLREGLALVLKSDDPAAEYDRWTAGCDSLPEALRHWNVVNVDDSGQIEDLWHHLRLSRNVLDHYMNHFVFPRHAKQFAVKLQSSGWDLPLFCPKNGAQAGARTTGFSGTNDNRRLLPLTIKQDDLPSLSQTSAEVLTYLLQARNRGYVVATDPRIGGRLSEEQLLRTVTGEGIRVLIDAGAYILEMDNASLVKKWLEIDTKAQGGVYFGNNDNRAWFQYRGGKESVPLLATPYAENLEDCLVYLDEAHTRGTDLKLPQRARGALTLALGQTKDHTVQAAMRLRQLATTQSVAFFAPPEVHQSILDVCNKRQGQAVDSADVIHWLLEQTCRANEQLQSLFNAQGVEFCRRMGAVLHNPRFLYEEDQRTALLRVIKTPERLTLEHLYGSQMPAGSGRRNDLSHVRRSSRSLGSIVQQLEQLSVAADSPGSFARESAMEEVEQEREVEFQVEEVREVQKPLHRDALQFPGLHPAISRFTESGVLGGGEGYLSASSFLASTRLGRKHSAGDIVFATGRLFVSAEFMRTVKFGPNGTDDNYLRPVEWVLWGPSTETALVIIPEEAELLIPVIRAAKKAEVYLIAYAAPVTKNMLHPSGLSYCVLPEPHSDHDWPTWLTIELGILGAMLYFDFKDYKPLLTHLRVPHDTGSGTAAPGDPAAAAGGLYSFLLEWLTIRRKGQDILYTPMGYVCQGRQLSESHPFFRGPVETKAGPDSGADEENCV